MDEENRQLERFIQGYIVCALWAGVVPLDPNEPDFDYDRDPDDLAPETVAQMRSDCADFFDRNYTLLTAYVSASDIGEEAWEYAGHDFWLTRNRHGAGFWDRGLGKLGEALTQVSHPYGECTLYACNDGKIYT